MGLAVGIDLGSTFSVVSINRNDIPEVITSVEGDRITPSVFAYDNDNQVLVGNSAVDYEAINPNNVVRVVKRHMGSNKRFIINQKEFSPEEISSQILKKLKNDAEVFLGQEITDAVITVPAYFNNDQRQSTKLAGELAGLRVLRIINEPTAASLAYGLDKTENSTILVYDLGGGTFDVTILKLQDGVDFHVLSTSGNTNLGGVDFDKKLANMILQKFNANFDYNYNQNTYDDLEDDQKARLREAAEKAKKNLSSVEKTTVIINYFAFRNRQQVSLNVQVTRQELEDLIEPLLFKTKECIDQALNDAKLRPNLIDQVVFVGGSTRTPFVAKKVEEWLGKKPNKTINPDEAVAIGAAIQASVLSGNSNKEVYLLDVCPLSLGVETQGGIMSVLIPRNTQVPAEHTEVFTTAIDNQNSVDVKVFQGERPKTKDNNPLGEFVLENLKEAPRGIPKIGVTFEIDADGILSVTANNDGEINKIKITGQASLSSEEINKILTEAKEHKEEDENFINIANLQGQLQDFIIQIEELVRTNVFANNDLEELKDLKLSLESDASTQNLELLYALIESSRETIKQKSAIIHQIAREKLNA